MALAEAVDRVDSGPYLGVRFSRDQMRELRYASLLHDFGKVGVREEVLVKAKKALSLRSLKSSSNALASSGARWKMRTSKRAWISC